MEGRKGEKKKEEIMEVGGRGGGGWGESTGKAQHLFSLVSEIDG